MTTPNKKMRFFRIDKETGARVPHILELDSSLTEVSLYADLSQADHVAVGRSTRQQEEASEGRRKGTVMARWACRSVVENEIEGSEELRDEFFEAVDALNATYAAKDEECPNCEMSKLMKRFRLKLEKAGLL